MGVRKSQRRLTGRIAEANIHKHADATVVDCEIRYDVFGRDIIPRDRTFTENSYTRQAIFNVSLYRQYNTVMTGLAEDRAFAA